MALIHVLLLPLQPPWLHFRGTRTSMVTVSRMAVSTKLPGEVCYGNGVSTQTTRIFDIARPMYAGDLPAAFTTATASAKHFGAGRCLARQLLMQSGLLLSLLVGFSPCFAAAAHAAMSPSEHIHALAATAATTADVWSAAWCARAAASAAGGAATLGCFPPAP